MEPNYIYLEKDGAKLYLFGKRWSQIIFIWKKMEPNYKTVNTIFAPLFLKVDYNIYMSRSFNSKPGKSAFASNKESTNSGINTNNKILSAFYCSNKCPRNISKVKNQSEYLLLQKAKTLNSCSLAYSSKDLNVNLISKIDLSNECVLKNNCTNICNEGIRFCMPIYLAYNIYPDNNNYCILNNNSEKRVYYPPPPIN
jgi:hypothetical protein